LVVIVHKDKYTVNLVSVKIQNRFVTSSLF
jgi:hypothetical protein